MRHRINWPTGRHAAEGTASIGRILTSISAPKDCFGEHRRQEPSLRRNQDRKVDLNVADPLARPALRELQNTADLAAFTLGKKEKRQSAVAPVCAGELRIGEAGACHETAEPLRITPYWLPVFLYLTSENRFVPVFLC